MPVSWYKEPNAHEEVSIKQPHSSSHSTFQLKPGHRHRSLQLPYQSAIIFNTMCQQHPIDKIAVPSMYDMEGVTTVPVCSWQCLNFR
jgi:hypothetical protein